MSDYKKPEYKVAKNAVYQTPHGEIELPSIKSHYCEQYNRVYYTTIKRNSMGQQIWGGSQFPASDETLCRNYGVPYIPAS